MVLIHTTCYKTKPWSWRWFFKLLGKKRFESIMSALNHQRCRGSQGNLWRRRCTSATPSETLDAARRSVWSLHWKNTWFNDGEGKGILRYCRGLQHLCLKLSQISPCGILIPELHTHWVSLQYWWCSHDSVWANECHLWSKNVYYNTDIMGLHKMVIKSRTDNKVRTCLVIFSDGEFDAQCSSNHGDYNTTHDNVIRLYADEVSWIATIV